MTKHRRFELMEDRRMLAYTFTNELVDLPLEAKASVMEIADLDLDSRPDLIVGTTASTVEILLGRDDGTFAKTAVTLPVKGAIMDIELADFNGDGGVDLGVQTDQQISTFTKTWLGFHPRNTFERPVVNALKIADLNRDGLSDLVYLSGNEVIVQLESNTSLADPMSWVLPAATETLLDVADIDSDGSADVVVVSRQGGAVALTTMLNDGTGSFAVSVDPEFSVAYAWETIISGQLLNINKDGVPDLVIGKQGADGVFAEIHYARKDGVFAPNALFRPGANFVKSALTPGKMVHTTSFGVGNGTFRLGGLFIEAPRTQSQSIDLAPWNTGITPHFTDLDGDGQEEILGLAGDAVAIYRSVDASVFSTDEIRHVVGFDAAPFFGDFDDDGFTDIAIVSDGIKVLDEDRMSVFWGGPSGLEAAEPMDLDWPDYVSWTMSKEDVVQDVNRDGKQDIILDSALRTDLNDKNKGGSVVVVNLGNRSFRAEFTQQNPKIARRSMMEADVNRDGRIDRVSTVGPGTSVGSVPLLDGIVQVRSGDPSVPTVNYGLHKNWDYVAYSHDRIHLGEFTGDGVLDVVHRNSEDNSIVILPGVSTTLVGDTNLDGLVNRMDLQLLSAALDSPPVEASMEPQLDVNGDLEIDDRDLNYWVEFIAGTRVGDVNLDGRVNFNDFITVAENFGKSNTTWGEGDFDGNGVTDFSDFLLLAENFGFDNDSD